MSKVNVPGVKRVEALTNIINDIAYKKIKDYKQLLTDKEIVKIADEEFGLIEVKEKFIAKVKEIEKLEEEANEILRHIRSVTDASSQSCAYWSSYKGDQIYKTMGDRKCEYSKFIGNIFEEQRKKVNNYNEKIKSLQNELWLCSDMKELEKIIEKAKNLEIED